MRKGAVAWDQMLVLIVMVLIILVIVFLSTGLSEKMVEIITKVVEFK